MAEGQDSSQEKTEEPTSKKMEKAREDGQVARSKELATTVLLVVAAMGMLLFGPFIAERMLAVASYNFAFDPAAARDETFMLRHLMDSVAHVVWALAPVFAVLL
ncbi:MAG: EscU/YscU/HrcU family type III secretion system export apparatus switch protein, partial [Natronospirillum sp.]